MIESILDKKGSDIVLIDIQKQATFADFFLICNGENERQLRAMADNIAHDAKLHTGKPALGIEGDPHGGWVLIDFGDLVVHLFSPEKREYYRLEDVWQEARTVMHVQ